MESPKAKYEVSVIVPTYNRCALLFHTLKSLVNQTISRDCFEVIIADDGSDDDTQKIIKEFERSLNLKYVYQPDKGYRPASVRNLGLKLSDAKICLCIDAGILINEDCIEQHINFHMERSYKDAAIGYLYGFEINEELIQMFKDLIVESSVSQSLSNIIKTNIFNDVRDEHYKRYNDCIEKLPAPWFYFWGGHFSVSKDQLLNINYFDENYDGRWGVEDNDLGYRLIQNGANLCLLRKAQSIHYPHPTNPKNRRLEGIANCEYFYRKFPGIETQLFLDYYAADGLIDINQMTLELAERLS